MRRIFNFKSFVLNEKRAQLNIPFDGTDTRGKLHHEHVLDAFEDTQVMKPDAYNSSANINKLVDDAVPNAAEQLEKEPERMRDVVMDFVYQNMENWQEIWDPTFLADNDISAEDFDDDNGLDLADKIVENAGVFRDTLTEEGKDTWDEFFTDKINDSIYAMVDTVSDSISNNDDGLISVWRAITYTKGEYDDVYDEIIKGHHGGVGIYWSWEENAAEAHWGETDGKLFVLHGQVRPEDVNWETSILKNVYDLKDEQELEMNVTAAIKLVGMTTANENGKDVFVEFDPAYVVKVGSTYRP